jgi:hypothetical protein
VKPVNLQIRQAEAADFPEVERMVVESFEPITWARSMSIWIA